MNNNSSVVTPTTELPDSLTIPPRMQWQVIVETSVAIGVALFAIFGNLLVFIAFYRDRTLRTIPNAFVFNLSVTDFLFATTRLPMFIDTLLVGRWSFSQTACIFQAFQGFNLFAVTLFTLSAISISRCFLIVYPIRYRLLFEEKRVITVIVGIWVVSGFLCAGPLFGWGEYKFDPQGSVCTFDHTSSASYHGFTNALVQIGVFIMVISYLRIFIAVRAYKKRIAHVSGNNEVACVEEENTPAPAIRAQDQRQRHEDMRITRTLLIVVCLFSLCWLPTAVISNIESRGVHLPRELRMFETISIAMNSMVNPVVYGTRSARFRRAFIAALTCQ